LDADRVAACLSVARRRIESAGGDPDAIMTELKASLAQYNAAY